MDRRVRTALFLAVLMAATAAGAADNVLLIQLRPGGVFKVWHTEGESQLAEEEVMALEVTAKPEGGAVMETSAGPARAIETGDGVMISLPAAKSDKELLVDRDACGHIRVWHGVGATNFSEDELTDIVISALPEGGKRITVGDFHVKAFIGKLGVTAAVWSAKKK